MFNIYEKSTWDEAGEDPFTWITITFNNQKTRSIYTEKDIVDFLFSEVEKYVSENGEAKARSFIYLFLKTLIDDAVPDEYGVFDIFQPPTWIYAKDTTLSVWNYRYIVDAALGKIVTHKELTEILHKLFMLNVQKYGEIPDGKILQIIHKYLHESSVKPITTRNHFTVEGHPVFNSEGGLFTKSDFHKLSGAIRNFLSQNNKNYQKELIDNHARDKFFSGYEASQNVSSLETTEREDEVIAHRKDKNGVSLASMAEEITKRSKRQSELWGEAMEESNGTLEDMQRIFDEKCKTEEI